MDLLGTFYGPLRFRPGGIFRASLAFGLKCGNLPQKPSAAPLLDERELGKTLWVGVKDMLEDVGTKYGGELEVLLLLML